jgi:hypothetical protein
MRTADTIGTGNPKSLVMNTTESAAAGIVVSGNASVAPIGPYTGSNDIVTINSTGGRIIIRIGT